MPANCVDPARAGFAFATTEADRATDAETADRAGTAADRDLLGVIGDKTWRAALRLATTPRAAETAAARGEGEFAEMLRLTVAARDTTSPVAWPPFLPADDSPLDVAGAAADDDPPPRGLGAGAAKTVPAAQIAVAANTKVLKKLNGFSFKINSL
jgi:hypothetical protein